VYLERYQILVQQLPPSEFGLAKEQRSQGVYQPHEKLAGLNLAVHDS
jgi:hypothetical protein